MKKVWFFLLCGCCLFGDVRLLNDSPYQLRATVLGADGSFLGELTLLPQAFSTWSSQNQNTTEIPNNTLTPYSVVWYCREGGVYGISTEVPEGSTVIAQDSTGPRICLPPQKKQSGAKKE